MSEVDAGSEPGEEPTTQDSSEESSDGEEDAPKLVFTTLDAWYSEFFVDLYYRDLGHGSRVWCPEWWLHAEALYRLDALWRSWEHLRLDGALGPSTWLRDHLDPHMAQLMSPDGPFKGCDPERGHRRRQVRLPGEPPAGMF